ncbi:MAG: SiaB family protein kinase [Pseudomonadota bacterium]
MLAQDLHNFRALLRKNGIMFAYSGYVSEAVLSGVGEALKQKLSTEDTDTKTIRSVFAVFVEQMQNIIRYSAEGDDKIADSELRYGVLTVGAMDGQYEVQAGNLILARDRARLLSRLQDISSMDKAQLKLAYKERLRAGPDESSKGAGVGFIEIARRASAPLSFDFLDIDADHAFFALKASIGTAEATP